MFVRMLKLPEEVRARYDLSSLRVAVHAAAPCPVEVKRAMIDWWGPILHEYYAATEGIGLTLHRLAPSGWPTRARSGRGAARRSCTSVDDDGDRAARRARSASSTSSATSCRSSYHDDPAKTAAAAAPRPPELDAPLGDIGYLDDDGYLYLTDRKAFMIISGGVNIYPQEVEDVLALHPAVADVAVIGVPDEEMGEAVKAVVQPAAGPRRRAGAELMDFCRERLARFKCPRSIDAGRRAAPYADGQAAEARGAPRVPPAPGRRRRSLTGAPGRAQAVAGANAEDSTSAGIRATGIPGTAPPTAGVPGSSGRPKCQPWP